MRRTSTLRIGTRASALALWQARHVAALIAQQSDAPQIELVHITTEGDVRTDVPLWTVGGKAFFTKEIDRALLAREIDVAVHSLKDLATQLADMDVPSIYGPASKGDWQLVTTAKLAGNNVLPAYAVTGPNGKAYGQIQGAPVPAVKQVT